MTTSTNTKERLKTDLEQAKIDSRLRAERIGEILKSAASLTFEEIKGGSAELNGITRKSVAELLEELKEVPVEADTETTDLQVRAEFVYAAGPEKPAPTWKEIIGHALEIVRDRKGDWFQQLKDYLNENAVKADGNLTEEYGDRYVKAKSLFQQIKVWVAAARAKAAQTSEADTVKPVKIEVMDDNTDNADSVNSASIG